MENNKTSFKIKKRKKPKKSTGSIVFSILNYTGFTLFTLLCIFPFYYLLINTISDNSLVQRSLINFYPVGIHFENYFSLRENSQLFSSFGVSVARTLIGTATMVLASAFIGYLMTKKEMKNRKFWYRFLIVTMYFNAGLIPWVAVIRMVGLYENFWAYIIPGIISPYNIILVKTYIESIPAELEESAYMDGAGYFTVFRTIIWPLSKPILATIAIFGAVGHWNSFMDSIILSGKNYRMMTMQHVLNDILKGISGNIVGGVGGIDVSKLNTKVVKYTITMVTIIPILLVYPIMQKYFEKGIMLGAVKG